MESCIYEGNVRHRRLAQVEHRFQYRLFMMYLDLDELPSLFDRFLLWSAGKRNVVTFRRQDHLGDHRRKLGDCVRELVYEQTGIELTGPIRLLTQLRHFGFQMNPVCFYYCFAQDGETLECVVAEVTNTPWGEQHCYVIDKPLSENQNPREFWNDKEFHVSPFMEMAMRYRWHLTLPGTHLNLHIENHPAERHERLFDATLQLQRREISHWSMAVVLLKFPLMTFSITARIYWQALRLWLKKVPFVRHPSKVAAPLESSTNASLTNDTSGQSESLTNSASHLITE